MNRLQLPTKLEEQARSGPAGLRDALEIWWAGVLAVTPERLLSSEVRLEANALVVSDDAFDLTGIRRVIVVGAGKASAGMAVALYQQCLSRLPKTIDVSGWINAPEESFPSGSKAAGPIYLYAARPAGVNEPTPASLMGTEQIMRRVAECGPADLCIALLSGGGSALLVSPIEGVTLRDKQLVASTLAAHGADIRQLNTVRRALSRVKGGGLASMCRARHLVTLIISDVLGDPLETIASGPTIASASVSPQAAMDVLQQLDLMHQPDLQNVVSVLRRRAGEVLAGKSASLRLAPVTNIILANNASAVDAAGVHAVELGYRYLMQSSRQLEGDVGPLAERISHAMEHLSREEQVDCWISGGEPTVKLPVPELRGRGGRNQQLALLSLLELSKRGWPSDRQKFPDPLLFLSAGTDGEDGPTAAAGAWFDHGTVDRIAALGLDPKVAARRADSASFFEHVGGSILSGSTGTNVCDLRVALKVRSES